MANGTGVRILVADDELEIRESLKEILGEEGHEVILADSERTAMEAAERGIDLAVLDVKLGSDNGIEVLRKLRCSWPQLPVVMITGFGTVTLAKEAFRLGAHDFLEKPLRLLQVRTCVRNAIEGLRLRKQLDQRDGLSEPIHCSQAMKALLQKAARLAQIREPVVILGPSGSGKDLLARYLHTHSPRSAGPFVATNAASMPVSLAEDELFGHEKGAFTGADKRREGCIERANGGSLFLDEIADMDPQIQAKLLRVLENGEFTRLGSAEPIRVNVRVVCATHKDLEALALQGGFRHDLWYRISAFVLQIPGLDKRPDDIPLLAQHFLDQMNVQLGVTKRFSRDALAKLETTRFDGNVRELKHLVARLAVYVDKETIGADDLLPHTGSPRPKQTPEAGSAMAAMAERDFRAARVAFEREFLRKALHRNEGNITATAREIGMAQSNLSRKLKELGMQDERDSASGPEEQP